MSATLGGLIKDLRLQKNISQLEIAFALGWKEPSRLSRIEQGKNTTPPRFLIENIMDAMKLSEEERNQLLLAGKYLPESKEIEKVRSKIKETLEKWAYPAYALDYTWRVIAVNNKLASLLGMKDQDIKVVESTTPHLFELAFNPTYIVNHFESEEEREARMKDLLVMVTQFLDSHRTNSREKWYQETIKRMMNNNLFKEIWPKARLQKIEVCEFANFGQRVLYVKGNQTRKPLHFSYFIVPLFNDPRFSVKLYVPNDLSTSEYYQKGI